MADTENLVLEWGGLALATDRVNELALELDNGLGASSHADFSGKRLAYLEQLHDLTHGAAKIVEVFAGVTTQAAFDAKLATRADAPARVVTMTLADKINGGSNTYWWSDRVVTGVDGLYQRALFTGHIDRWRYTLNRFVLELSGTERAEERTIPQKTVTLDLWPNSRFEQEGHPYPEVWGAQGAALDASKIGDGIGAVAAVLVDRAALKYVVAGHALKSVAGVTSGTVAVWAKVPGIESFLGYIEGCVFNLADADAKGNPVTSVSLPEFPKIVCFIPGLATGSYFANTAQNPANAAGRDPATFATVNNGQRLQMAYGESIDQGTQVFRVWIACSVATADLRARWCGPQSNVQASPGKTVEIDSAAGWSASGKVQLSTGVFEYTGITQIDADTWSLALTADPGEPTGKATEVGDWMTLTSAEREVTAQRNWDETNFAFLEIELENTHASNNYNVAFLGFRVELAAPSFPEVYVPCAGVGVIHQGVDQGATRNPALIVKDLHTRVLGLAESRIGGTFAPLVTLLGSWKLDMALTRQLKSEEALRRLLEQFNAFLWRDADNAVQLGRYRLGDVSTVTLDSAADIVDAEGDAFEIGYTAPEEIRSRVYLNWRQARFRDEFTRQSYITEANSNPKDSAREAAAAASQAANRVTNTLILDAPDIQDEATALELLQFLFDFHSVRRRALRFQTPMHVNVNPGTVILVTHPLLTQSENYLVRNVTRRANLREIEAIALGIEGNMEDLLIFEVKASAAQHDGWGSPGYLDPLGGDATGSQAETKGRVVDYGLGQFARRLFEDAGEKPSHGQIGGGSGALDPAQLLLTTPFQERVGFWPGHPIQGAGKVTWRFQVTAVGAGLTLWELGLFSAAVGSKLLARVLFASGLALAQDQTALVTLTIECRRPTAGSTAVRALTDYGARLFANRIWEDTAEKPTHYAIGSNAAAENPADVALAAQISTRSPWATGYPAWFGTYSKFNAVFAAGTHGGNTVREAGIFTAATGNNCLARKVLQNAVVLGANDGFTASHRLTAGHEA
jgi:hypothetical protein